MAVFAVIDDSLSPTSPLGDAVEAFIRREDAERFVEDVRQEDPERAAHLIMIPARLRRINSGDQRCLSRANEPSAGFVSGALRRLVASSTP